MAESNLLPVFAMRTRWYSPYIVSFLLVVTCFTVAAPESRAMPYAGDPIFVEPAFLACAANNDRDDVLKETTAAIRGGENLAIDVCGTIAALIETIQGLNLNEGLENALIVKLNNALASFTNGNYNAAINQLEAFINQVEAKRGKPLTNAEADDLIAGANAMITAIQNGTAECGGPEIQCPPDLTASTNQLECCAIVDLPDMLVDGGCPPFHSPIAHIEVRDAATGELIETIDISGNLTNFPGNDPADPDTLAVFGLTPCLPLGTHTVVYEVGDNCGNISTCSFQLTVRDYPIAVCDEYTVVAIGTDAPNDCYEPNDACDGAGVTWVKASTFDDGSYDICNNNLKWTIQRVAPYSDCIAGLNECEYEVATAENDSIKFYCCESGTTQMIVMRVYQLDASGEMVLDADGLPIFNSCLIEVEVQDKIKPVCIPPEHVTVSCEAFDPSLEAYGIPTVSDNCCLNTSYDYQGQCGLSHTANYTLFDELSNVGTITRSFRTYDCHGQSAQCTQRIVVTDERSPTLICLNGLAINIMPDGMITLWATDFIASYGEDNCTPSNLLVYAIRKGGQGEGFPVDAFGNPVTSVTFDCNELGQQLIELWVRDLAGNADYCVTFIDIQDPNDWCNPGKKITANGALNTAAGNKPVSLPEQQMDRMVTGIAGHTAIELFPNPAGTEVNIQLNGLKNNGTVTIFDQLGSAVWQQPVEEGMTALKVNLAGNAFVPGVYFVSLRLDNEVISRRLIVSE